MAAPAVETADVGQWRILAPIGVITGAGLAGITALAIWAGSGNPVLNTTMAPPAPPPALAVTTTTYPPFVPASGAGGEASGGSPGTAKAPAPTTAPPANPPATPSTSADATHATADGAGSGGNNPTPPTTAARAPVPPQNPQAVGGAPLSRPAPTTSTTLNAGSSTSYAFVVRNPDGNPASFDPCIPVAWYLSTYEMPAGAAGDVTRAVSMVASATGLNFVYRGTTDQPAWLAPPTLPAAPDGWPPVVIGWGHNKGSSVEGIFASPTAPHTALMGITQNELSPESGRSGYRTLVGGVVEFSLDYTEPAGFAPWQEGVVYLHELGHLVGLDHVADPAQIMHAGPDGQPGRYGAGDLAGLKIVGSGSCAAPLAPDPSGAGAPSGPATTTTLAPTA